jgi:hypothetical protein
VAAVSAGDININIDVVAPSVAADAPSFVIREANATDVLAASELIATAYGEQDSWYKKPTYKNRVDLKGDRVRGLLAEETGVLLVAVDDKNDDKNDDDSTASLAKQRQKTGALLGAVHVEWPSAAQGGIPGHPQTTQLWSFGMLSVPRRNAGKGIGRALVAAAEARLSTVAKSKSASSSQSSSASADTASQLITIDVMETLGPRRRNLIEWYRQQEYVEAGAATPAWWSFAVADHLQGTIMVQRMTKELQ